MIALAPSVRSSDPSEKSATRRRHALEHPDLCAGAFMDLLDLISRLALALGIGLLIGLERGWRTRGARPGSRAAGIRTFAISGLLGGIVAAVAQAVGGATSLGGGIVLGSA